MINTINIEIRYFDMEEYPRYDVLSNEISRYSQNIEILPSTTHELSTDSVSLTCMRTPDYFLDMIAYNSVLYVCAGIRNT